MPRKSRSEKKEEDDSAFKDEEQFQLKGKQTFNLESDI